MTTLAERVTVDGRRHAELLAAGMAEVLEAGEPEVVVVGVGPGPFTGLRVGIMTAAAFGDARGLPVLGACSLDGLCPLTAGPDQAPSDPIRSAPRTGVVTDARRKEVYWAGYDAAGVRVDGPHVTTPAIAQESMAGLRVVGDGALLHGFVTDDEPRYPVMAVLAERAVRAHLAGEPPLPLTPLYLRRPDAVEPTASKRVTR